MLGSELITPRGFESHLCSKNIVVAQMVEQQIHILSALGSSPSNGTNFWKDTQVGEGAGLLNP